MAFSYLPRHTRKDLEGMEQLTRPDLSRAYLAILHDAERLENSHLDPADARTPEFQYLVFLMHHIVQKALQGQTYSSTSGSTSERLLELYENLKQNWLPKVSEERQVVSADDCLCWLVRLVARHQKPKTPEDFLEELNDLDIARELKSGSVIISASGLPNHVSISIRTVDAAQESGDMSTDQHVAEVTGGTYYVVATNREHYTDSQLGRWATESWRDRFQEYAPLVAEATERVKQRLKQPNCQSGTARLVAIQQWKQEGSLVFDHMDKDELAVTFSVAGGFKFCARCAKCRALFAYRMCSECNKLEEDLSSLEGIVNGNTCSEGLLHLLRVQARAEISKGTAGRAADNENEKAVDGHGGT